MHELSNANQIIIAQNEFSLHYVCVMSTLYLIGYTVSKPAEVAMKTTQLGR